MFFYIFFRHFTPKKDTVSLDKSDSPKYRVAFRGMIFIFLRLRFCAS